MADDSELDYIADFLRKVHIGTLEFTDTVASVTTGTRSVVMTVEGGTLNQWAGYKLMVHSGDNAGTIYTVESNDLATPTTLVVEEAIPADLATDVVGLYYYTDGHTVKTIETTRNVNFHDDSQAILVYAGHALGSSGIILNKQYHLQYRDATEGALNSSIYALIEGMRKLNARETITGYTRNTSLVGMRFLNSSKDFFQPAGGNWYANIYIIVKWLTI